MRHQLNPLLKDAPFLFFALLLGWAGCGGATGFTAVTGARALLRGGVLVPLLVWFWSC